MVGGRYHGLLHYSPVERYLGCLGPSQTKLLWTFVYRVLREQAFPSSGINAQKWALAIFDSTHILENMNMLCPLEVNASCTQTNERKNRKSCPHPNVYFYINIVLTIEDAQHFCSNQHMPDCVPSLLCMLTHLSSRQPSEVHTLSSSSATDADSGTTCLCNLTRWPSWWPSGLRTPRFDHYSAAPHSPISRSHPLPWLRWQPSRGWVTIHQRHLRRSTKRHCGHRLVSSLTHRSVIKLTWFDHLCQMEAASGF